MSGYRRRLHGGGHRITQYLAGARELLHRYDDAPPEARAVLDAAADARRFGAGEHLPQSFVQAAAAAYLDPRHWETQTDTWRATWFTRALTYTAKPCRGVPGPLTPKVAPPGQPRAADGPLQLSDYLKQHLEETRRLDLPPAGFWAAAEGNLLTIDDRVALADAARRRWRLRLAAELFDAPAQAGHSTALLGLARIHLSIGDEQRADLLFARAADQGSGEALGDWYWLRKNQGDEAGAHYIDRRAADAGEVASMLRLAVAEMTDAERDEMDERFRSDLAEAAARAGHTDIVDYLTALTAKSWTESGAAQLEREARENGYEEGQGYLSGLWRLAHDAEARTRAYEAGAAQSHPEALYELAHLREEAGSAEDAIELLRRAARSGHDEGASALAWRLRERGDLTEAEYWFHELVRRGHPDHWMDLASMCLSAGDPPGLCTATSMRRPLERSS
ncbi:hypothetical protein [Streptomyces sp. CA-132043]|uniref:hypothetical protein n=1 Tax=Streptomyces sp. CA-132043 TaxID=3240048 RepID=UPI003D92B08A